MNSFRNASSGSKGISLHPALASKALKLEQDLIDAGIGVGSHQGQESANDAFVRALGSHSMERMDRFLSGVEKYRAAPCCRDLPETPAALTDGASSLLSFGRESAHPPVLVVPSLVNRSYILDLETDRSFMRWLGRQGFQAYLIDWGSPLERECGFSLTDYTERLCRFIRHLKREHGRRISLAGYCMGGLLALAAAIIEQENTDRLALLATPWDFHADQNGPPPALQAALPALRTIIESAGFLPTDILQSFFATLDPFLALNKFSRFAGMEENSPRYRSFVALEDWLNDGVPLAGPAALECFEGWYLHNAPAQGKWQIGNLTVDPAVFRRPSLSLIPGGDRIVPPASAKALSKALPGCRREVLSMGHIGMMAGSRAEEATWPLIARFLSEAG